MLEVVRAWSKIRASWAVPFHLADTKEFNFIRRNAKSDIDFTCYEDENISIDSNDNYHNIVNLD